MEEVNSYKKLSIDQIWSLGLSAILTEVNTDDHFLIAEKTDAPHVINALQRDWGVTNRKELLDTINWCCNNGHRNEFHALSESLKNMSVENIKSYINAVGQQDDKRAIRLQLVYENRYSLGEQGIKAFDLGRAVMLCRWGYAVSWLTEEEVWSLIKPIAEDAKHSFTSWDSFAVSYVVGSHYIRKDLSKELFNQFSKIIHKLLLDQESPWVFAPWVP